MITGEDYYGTTPEYSSQCNPQHIGGGDWLHDYYTVSEEEYDAMEEKPELHKVCRPFKCQDFDGFREVVQDEKDGIGWTEREGFYPNIHSRYYFVE